MKNVSSKDIMFDVIAWGSTLGFLLAVFLLEQYRLDFLWAMFFGGLFYLSTEFFAREPLRFTEKLFLLGIGEISGLMIVGIGHLLSWLIKYVGLFL